MRRLSSIDLRTVLATLDLASNGFGTGLDLRQVTNEVLDLTLTALPCAEVETQKAAASPTTPVEYVSANRQAHMALRRCATYTETA